MSPSPNCPKKGERMKRRRSASVAFVVCDGCEASVPVEAGERPASEVNEATAIPFIHRRRHEAPWGLT